MIPNEGKKFSEVIMFYSILVVLYELCIFFQCWISIAAPKDPENGNDPVQKAKAGTAGFLVQLENRRSIKVVGSTSCHFSHSVLKIRYLMR